MLSNDYNVSRSTVIAINNFIQYSHCQAVQPFRLTLFLIKGLTTIISKPIDYPCVRSKDLASKSSRWEQHILKLFLLNKIFLWMPMFKEYRWTKATSRKPRCLSAGSSSLYLQLKPTIRAQRYPRKHIRCTTRFKNIIFRHHYVMQKNTNCFETDKSHLCKALHFNRQNLMLLGPPNDWATAYGSCWKYPTEH